MRWKWLLIFCLTGMSSSYGQITVQEEVQTDSVDVFGARETGKSPGVAMAASILLPGLGHHYLNQPKKAFGFFALEASMWFGYIYSGRYSRHLVDDAKVLAYQEADAMGGAGADDYYWQNVGLYMGIDEYNSVLELNRTENIEQEKFLKKNLYWNWSSDSLRQEYQDLRLRATRFRVASSFVLAAMVINRVVAFIDTRVATKYRGIRGERLSSLRVHPYRSGEASGMMLHADF